jgi:hypothetical protein
MPEEATVTEEETSQETPDAAAGSDAAEATPDEAVASEDAQQPKPPETDEAIRQLQSQNEQILSRLPEQEQESTDIHDILGAEYEDETESGDPATGQSTEADEAREFLRGLVREELEPIQNQWQVTQRWQGIDALTQRYPDINETKVAEGVRDQLERHGLFPGDGSPPHPGHVEMAYKALKADAVVAAETPAEVGGEEGATLETGAGPNQPVEEEDPQVKAYKQVFGAGDGPRDVFS